jgi:hypothetical protein
VTPPTPSAIRAYPERVLRTVVLFVCTSAAFAPLALRGLLGKDAATGARDAFMGLLLLVLAAVQSVRAEQSPEDLDSPSARRAKRFAPTAVGLLLAGLFFFPRFEAPWTQGGGAYLVLLFFVNLPLAAFWHVPSVRAVSLVVASVAALGATVIVPDDAAAPCLLPVAAAWVLVPALDRLALVRGRLDPRPDPRLRPTLAAGAAVLVVGLALFAASTLVLPPSVRRWTSLNVFSPSPTRTGPVVPPPDVPVGKLLGLLMAAALTLLAWNAYASSRGRRSRPPELVLPMAASAARPLDPAAIERALGAWPAGARREVVQTYLDHLRALEARAALRQPGTTPLALARRLDQAAAARLAERFGRARWDPAPIATDDAARARDEAAEVERARG